MFTFSSGEGVHLRSPWFKRSHASANAKQHQLRYIAKIKSDASPVRSTVFTNLEPNNIRFVGEAPRLHHSEAFHQEGVRTPQVKMRSGRSKVRDRQIENFLEFHRRIAKQSAMLWCYLSRSILKLPWRIS